MHIYIFNCIKKGPTASFLCVDYFIGGIVYTVTILTTKRGIHSPRKNKNREGVFLLYSFGSHTKIIKGGSALFWANFQ